MSPEQIRAKPLDTRTDLFSFGVVLYEMATGKLPFRGESAGAIFDSILNTAPVPPVRLNPDLPQELERIIDKCLEKDRNLRYQHASEIRADLKRLKRDTDSGRTPAVATRQTTTAAVKRWKIVVPALAAVLALTAAGYFYFRRRTKLTDKDTIVLADFTNTTGDPVFDGTLRQGLAVQLEQSPFLSLISDQRIQEELRLMVPAGGCAAYSRRGPANLRANQQCRRPGRLHRTSRKPVRSWVNCQELPHRRRTRRGAGASCKERRRPECPESNRQQIPDASRRIARHH